MLYCTYNLYKGKIMKRVYLSKGWVFAFLLILGVCSSEDYLFRSVPSSFGEKESMQSRALRQSLERQINVWNYTQELCLRINRALDDYTGILGLKQVNVSKVRVILDELFMGAEKGMTLKSIRKTLYSNWVDVSNEDFSAVLHR